MNIILKGQKQLEKKLNKIQTAVKKGEVRALNKTATKAKTQATKAIGKQIILPAKYIKSKLWISKANKNKPYAKIEAQKRGIQLRRFYAKHLHKKGKPAGIAVKVKRRGRQKKIPGGFLIKLKRNNGYGIAMRKKGAKGRNNYKVLYGPSPSQVFDQVRPEIEPEIRKTLKRNMQHEIQYAVSKIK
jgi:hypothetical protein